MQSQPDVINDATFNTTATNTNNKVNKVKAQRDLQD